MKSRSRDMTVGSPLRLLTAFTLPALAGNLLNQVYSITDSIIVGRYLGQTSLAAIGVTMPIVLLTAAMVIGLNVGVGILLSQSFGRKDIGQMRHTFANSFYLAGIIAVFTTLVGLPLTVPILKLMGTPAAPLTEAASYLHINFATTLFPLLYYLFNNAFRGMGDSMTALWCLIVSVVINVFLDILFVAVFGWGVPGSAWATAIAQAMSVVFSAIMLYRRFPEMRLKREDFRLDRPLLAVPTLQGMAAQYYTQNPDYKGMVCPMIDARRMECYTAVFTSPVEELKPVSADIITEGIYDQWLNRGEVTFIGDGAEKTRPILSVHPHAHYSSDFVHSATGLLTVALEKMKAGHYEDVAYFEPYYLKDFVAKKSVVRGLH